MSQQIKLVKQDLSDAQLEFYSNQELLAVDCEMMGLNLTRDRLCLVQISDEKRNVVLVQIEKGQAAAPNLKKLLEADHVRKIFHFARTDIVWLEYWLKIKVDNVFCTKISSKIARTYTDKHALKDLCKEIIGKELNKNQQSSDWGNDTLDTDQQTYAAYDVVYLIPIYRKIMEMLERENKLELAMACLNFLPVLAKLDTCGYQGVLEH